MAIAICLSGCAGDPVKPASVEGECLIFTDPGFEVKGQTVRDQRWIALTQESGITSCGWARPVE